MPIITLPDGSQRSFDHPVSVLEVAQSIGTGLAKATLVRDYLGIGLLYPSIDGRIKQVRIAVVALLDATEFAGRCADFTI